MAGTRNGFDMERFFQALGDRTRLRLLNLIGDDEICVCFFVESLGTNQPKVSRHLAYLRKAGVVTARREGKWMHYRIVEPSDPHAAEILRTTRAEGVGRVAERPTRGTTQGSGRPPRARPCQESVGRDVDVGAERREGDSGEWSASMRQVTHCTSPWCRGYPMTVRGLAPCQARS